jgi:hypothetical protein
VTNAALLLATSYHPAGPSEPEAAPPPAAAEETSAELVEG